MTQRRRRANAVAHVWPATPDDIAYLPDIHATAFSRGWTAAEFEALLGPENVHAFVLRLEGEGDGPPRGFVILRQVAEEAEIVTLALDNPYRGRGHGETLMREAILHLKRARVARLLLEVDETNAAALGLYRKLGFLEVGRRKGYYTNTPVVGETSRAAPTDALVMALPLL